MLKVSIFKKIIKIGFTFKF